jgi:hypothetical protein
MGIPTILTDAHGHHEFSHLGLRVGTTKVPAGKFLYGDAGSWWEPDFDTAVDHMRDVYENYDKHETLAWENSQRCHQEFHYGHSAKVMEDTIGLSQVTTEGEWHLSQAKLFLLRVGRFVDPFIGGVSYFFERKHDYYAPADVRRVIQEAGFLDESCLSDQTGQLPHDGMDFGLVTR